MLLYTKITTNEGVTTKKVFGTTENIPAATDKEIVCKNAKGENIAVVAGDAYVDNGKGGIKRLSDNADVNVFVVAKDGTEVPVLVSEIEVAPAAAHEVVDTPVAEDETVPEEEETVVEED
jgi:hypothetical protein